MPPSGQVVPEPGRGETRDFVEPVAFFEQVRRTGNDFEMPLARELIAGSPVQLDDPVIDAADDQQRRRLDFPQRASAWDAGVRHIGLQRSRHRWPISRAGRHAASRRCGGRKARVVSAISASQVHGIITTAENIPDRIARS